MIQAEKQIAIEPVLGANPIADTQYVHSEHLVITISQDDEHYPLFQTLLQSLHIKVTDKIKSV